MKINILSAAATASILGFASTANAAGATCPFVRPPNPPLASYPPLHPNDISLQNLFSTYNAAYNELLIGTFGGLYSSVDGGKTFTTLKKTGDNFWGGIRTSKGTYLASTPQSLLRSSGSGSSIAFTSLNVMAPGNYPLSSTAGNMFAQVGSQIIWGTQNGFYVSENDGLTWTALDCSGLIALANTPTQTINGCEYLFVRSMAVTPDNTRVLSVFTALGLSGVYSLKVPIAKNSAGKYTPVYETVLYSPICDILPQDANEGTLCSQSGPIAVFNSKVFVGSGMSLKSVPLVFGNKAAKATTVLKAASAESEMVGLSVSLDKKVIVASWSGSAFSSPTGDPTTWIQPVRSACSSPNLINWYPTNPQGYFTRSISPSTKTPPAGYASFAIGTSRGPYIWNVQVA
ncbi:hypothetical protein HDU97_005867 [Phlyctochytrium planicorne]|nr:hypothetical protein HDU97_005867 [Phlyctochytrium planicorne]